MANKIGIIDEEPFAGNTSIKRKIMGLKLVNVAISKQLTKLGILSIRWDHTDAIIIAGIKPTTIVKVNNDISPGDNSKK